ncbi:hypothetical protein BH10PLA2_BH10PLA2_30890 [soil metagenome]
MTVRLESQAKNGILLQVTDTGQGIRPEFMERLFRPFASTKMTGSGLGLSISKRIIEEHKGKLEGANRAEGGACFTILLPETTCKDHYADSTDH